MEEIMFKDRPIRLVKGLAWIVLSFLLIFLLGTQVTSRVEAGKPTPTPPPAQGSFIDQLDAYGAARWAKADGWTNGSPFDNAWRADHITFANSQMNLVLDSTAYLGEPYSSGEYRSLGFYSYGCFEASFQPVARPGVVTSLYTFAGPYDNGGNGKHNEIDIEFLGYDTNRFQANFWTNDDAYARGHEHMVTLGFDASQGLHRYGFKWTSTGVTWYVDGAAVYNVADTVTDPTPKTGDSLHKIMMNLWPVDSTASAWAGTFVYPGTPLVARYDWVRYTAGEACTMNSTPPPTPTPGGSSTAMHVQSIGMALASRNNQATAKVIVLDGTGKPVTGATVAGKWSGLVTSGDGSKTTASDGSTLFYSGRSSSPGTFTFCVTGITKTGLTYDAPANGETCDSVSK
jgi:endo-1,3-1,4-beta-glycanase ExoK